MMTKTTPIPSPSSPTNSRTNNNGRILSINELLAGQCNKYPLDLLFATPTQQPRCDICGTRSFTDSILSCHRCITVQHTFCLPNPLVDLPDRRWLCPACSESSRRQYPSRSRRQSNGSIGQAGKKTSSGFPAANGAGEVDVNASSSSKASEGGGAVVVLANGDTAGRLAAVPSRKGGRKVSTAATAVGEKEAAISSDATPGLSNGLPSSVEEQESSDPGSTVTLFCRRDFRRYLRWKQRELASQDDERRKDEQTRARKTFSSIIASNDRR